MKPAAARLVLQEWRLTGSPARLVARLGSNAASDRRPPERPGSHRPLLSRLERRPESHGRSLSEPALDSEVRSDFGGGPAARARCPAAGVTGSGYPSVGKRVILGPCDRRRRGCLGGYSMWVTPALGPMNLRSECARLCDIPPEPTSSAAGGSPRSARARNGPARTRRRPRS